MHVSEAPTTIATQLRQNAVALISLAVAVTSLAYTTWRTERSENNRTTRQASFQLLVALGDLQQVVFHAHYDHDQTQGNPRTGWVYVLTITDFSSTMPTNVAACANSLHDVWRDHWEGLGTRDADAEAIANTLDHCRAEVVSVLKALR